MLHDPPAPLRTTRAGSAVCACWRIQSSPRTSQPPGAGSAPDNCLRSQVKLPPHAHPVQVVVLSIDRTVDRTGTARRVPGTARRSLDRCEEKQLLL